MEVNSLEKVVINGSEQWILVRGKSIDSPLIIHIQAGPGLPMIPEAKTLENLLHLEENYLVAYWDQRACGKSYSAHIKAHTIKFSQLTEDVISCTRYLLGKYKKEKAIVIGYSIGASISLMAAAMENNIFDCLFLTGIDADIHSADKYALEFLMLKLNGNKRLLKQVINLCQGPIINTKQFQKRARLLTDLGGIITGSTYNQLLVTSFTNMLNCKGYHLWDIPKTINGMRFCQNALLPELNNLNLFEKVKRIGVPVHFIQGKKDAIAPYPIAVKYYNFLQAAEKTITIFEHSAHMPHYEEPEKFSQLIKDKTKK